MPKRPLLEMDLNDAGAFKIKDRRGLVEWLNREYEFWKWMQGVSRQDLGLQNDARSQLTAPLQQAQQATQKLSEDSIAEDDITQIQSFIAQYARAGLVSTSPRAQYVKSIRGHHGDLAAAAAVAEHLNSVWVVTPDGRTQINNQKLIRIGRTAMAMFELGVGREVNDSRTSSAEERLENLSQRLSEEISKGEAETEALASARATLTAQLSEQADKQKEEWAAFVENANKGMNENVTNFQNTEKAYKEQMKLRAAVSYWTGRGGIHTTAARDQLWWLRTYGIVSGLAILAGGACLVWAIIKIVETLGERSTTPLLFLGGFALLIASAVLWIARLMVRVYFDERRRSHDATERATMAEAYAALTSEGLVSDAERVIVLSALFRPTGDGSAREDSAPESIQHAILAKLLDQDAGKKS